MPFVGTRICASSPPNNIGISPSEIIILALGDLDSYTLCGQWGVTLQARPGLPYGVIVGRDFERAPDGQVIYENGLPKVDGSQQVLGAPISEYWLDVGTPERFAELKRRVEGASI